MTRCPVAGTCRWHERARVLLMSGQLERLRADKDILLTLLTRAWRGCTCGLARRVKAVL